MDADRDGVLNGNEVLTMAAMALGKEPDDDAEVDALYACASGPRPLGALRALWARLSAGRPAGRAARWADPARAVTLRSVARCPAAADGLRRHAKARSDRRGSYHLERTLDEVAFEMLSDDYNATKSQLDSIRARRTKFICVNDNVDDMTPKLARLFSDFFESFYPKRSQFELPAGDRNRHLRLDAYRRERRRDRVAAALAAAALAAAGLALGGARAAGRPQTAGASADDADDRPKAE